MTSLYMPLTTIIIMSTGRGGRGGFTPRGGMGRGGFRGGGGRGFRGGGGGGRGVLYVIIVFTA